MDEESFSLSRDDSQEKAKKGRSWEEEMLHLCGPFVKNARTAETSGLINKIVQKYHKDPLIKEFGDKYLEMLNAVEPLFAANAPADPVEKMNFVIQYFSADPARVKAIADFVSVAHEVSHKYKIFDGTTAHRRKNNLTPKESSELERNVSPLFQWFPKIKLHIESKKREKDSEELQYPEHFNAFTKIAEQFQNEMKLNDLEKLFKEKGSDPFRSMFAKKRHAAFNQIQTCKTEHIAAFLIRHKDDHPEYMDAIFRKAKRGDRDFLKEFDAEPDHASLKKLYNTSGVGLKFVDKINKAYRYKMETRLSLAECIEKLSDNIIPKELQTALMAKMKMIAEQGFKMPTAKEMNSFVSDLKAALSKPEGLNYSNYVKLLVETNPKVPSRTAMFGLERDVFPNNKVFKLRPDRAAPVAPPRVSAPLRNNLGRPQK